MDRVRHADLISLQSTFGMSSSEDVFSPSYVRVSSSFLISKTLKPKEAFMSNQLTHDLLEQIETVNYNDKLAFVDHLVDNAENHHEEDVMRELIQTMDEFDVIST